MGGIRGAQGGREGEVRGGIKGGTQGGKGGVEWEEWIGSGGVGGV